MANLNETPWNHPHRTDGIWSRRYDESSHSIEILGPNGLELKFHQRRIAAGRGQSVMWRTPFAAEIQAIDFLLEACNARMQGELP